MLIPFTKPYMTGLEITYISKLTTLCGDGFYTHRCHEWIEKQTSASKVLLTPSCTAALEISALLIDIKPGDEVIMPSFTFVSTANAFVLRGATPVFVDIREDTLNLDERLLEAAITPKTKAIVPVHYAGVSCNMDSILSIAEKHNLYVIEDAAQGFLAGFKGQALGTMGHLGTFSFHETKNISCGEGGALLINDKNLKDNAEIIREKGTNRSRFLKGQVDKYTWQSLGSSYLPNEMTAAFLYAQLEAAEMITQKRMKIWQAYHDNLAELEAEHYLRRPIIPKECEHNAHIYYILIPAKKRDKVISLLREKEIQTTFHYIPLHQSPAGMKYGRINKHLPVTDQVANEIIRLPLFCAMDNEMIDKVISSLKEVILKC